MEMFLNYMIQKELRIFEWVFFLFFAFRRM
jgi:hypothetical protein